MSDDLLFITPHRFDPTPSTAGCQETLASISNPKASKFDYGNIPSFALGSWLRTPPVGNMSTTYHPAMTSAYDPNAAVNAYSASMAHSARAKAAMIEGSNTQYPRYVQQQPAHSSQQRYADVSVGSQFAAVSAQPSRPLTPKIEQAVQQKAKVNGAGPADSLIYHSLQIPRCITPNGGNLSDFAAQVCSVSYHSAPYRVITEHGVTS